MPPKIRAAPRARRAAGPQERYPRSRSYIKSTLNQHHRLLTDLQAPSSPGAPSGQVGFAGSRCKSTPIAAQLAAEAAAWRAQEHGMKKVDVSSSREPGSGRETAIRLLQAAGPRGRLDHRRHPQAFNGCRPPALPRLRATGRRRSRCWVSSFLTTSCPDRRGTE